MGLCWGAPEVDAERSASAAITVEQPGITGVSGGGEVRVKERQAYDTDLRHHLISHSTPHRVETTITAAAVFTARARLAHEIVAKRKADSGCESSVALLRSPSAAAREEETLRAQMSREEKIADGLKLLRQRAEHVGVKIIHMEDDGNCQFRSLAQELYGDQELHHVVRETVVEYLRTNSVSYSFYVGEQAEWLAYLRRMANLRTWGDELTLRGASDCYGCVIHVVTTEHENWLLNYVPSALESQMVGGETGSPPAGTRECFLAYVSPIHYNVIVPLSDAHQASATGY